MKITDVTLSILRTELAETVIPTHGAEIAAADGKHRALPPDLLRLLTGCCVGGPSLLEMREREHRDDKE